MRLTLRLSATFALFAVPLAAQDTLLVAADNPPVWGTDIEVVEELRIGALEGPDHEVFGNIVGIVADSAGQVIIADSQIPGIRVFSSDGRYLMSLGRSGEGPGEFLRLTSIAPMPGGGFVAQDSRRARGILFDAQLTYRADFPLLATLNSVSTTFQSDVEGHIYAKAVVFDAAGPPNQLEGLREWPLAWIKHGPRLGVLDSILVPLEDAVGPEITFLTPEGPRYPFTVETVSSISPAGYLIWGRNDTYAFHRRLPDGRIVRITRTAERPVVSSAERSEWSAVAAYFERERGADPYPPVPREKPFFRDLSADIDGRVWVQRYSDPYRYRYSAEELAAREGRPTLEWREPQTFDVFEPQGRFLGTVRLPRRMRLGFARGMTLWAIAAGDYEEQYVVRLTIHPAQPF